MENRNLLWATLITSITSLVASLACLGFLLYVVISHGSSIADGFETCQGLAQTFKELSTKSAPASVTEENLPKQPPFSLEGIETVDGKILIPRRELKKLSDNMSRLYTSLRAVPYFKDGQVAGFKILSVSSGSFFEQIGIRRGDVLVSINGQMIDIQSGLNTFTALEGQEKIQIGINRKGADQVLEIRIVE